MTTPVVGHGDELWTGAVADDVVSYPLLSSVERVVGHVWSVVTDTVEIGDHTVERDYVQHPGAVAVVAMDEFDRIYLLRQYRHPVGMALFETPAGLIDVAHEDPLLTAQRELAEEAGLIADTWNVLVDFFNSPGGSSEAIRFYLARDVRPRPGGRVLTGEAEEVHLPGVWLSIGDAVDLVLAGKLANPCAVVGALAAAAALANNWTSLRPANAQWTAREHLIATGRVRYLDTKH